MRSHRTLTVLSAGLALVALAAPASAKVNPAANRPEFWQTDTTTCVKTELTDGVGTWTLPVLNEGSYALLVLKAGTANTVIAEPVPGLGYTPENGKDISHVITCVGEGDDGGAVLT